MLLSIKAWAHRVKRDSVTLWFAYRDPATPMAAKAISIIVVAYALSPIDLIPDFIPVLGYLDDLILLPVLVWLAVRMVPQPILEASRLRAEAWMQERRRKPISYAGAMLVIGIWLAIAGGAWYWYRR